MLNIYNRFNIKRNQICKTGSNGNKPMKFLLCLKLNLLYFPFNSNSKQLNIDLSDKK